MHVHKHVPQRVKTKEGNESRMKSLLSLLAL